MRSITVSMLSSGWQSPTPKLAVTCSTPGKSLASMLARIVSANVRAALRSVSGQIIRNSSPPQRPTVSVSRQVDCRILANSCRTISPVLWPYVSLTALKWSISSNMMAVLFFVFLFSAGLRASASERHKRFRFDSWVRASISATFSRSRVFSCSSSVRGSW